MAPINHPYLRWVKLLLLICVYCLATTSSFCQEDLLVLKQRDRTIQTWIAGSVITFQYSSKQWVQGILKKVKNDSITVEQISINMVANQFGLPTVDTFKMGLMKLHVSEIYGMPKRDYSGIITNGSLFMIGSGGYMALNLANTLIHKDPLFSAANATRLGIAGGVFLLGTILSASHKTYIVLGKKYTMQTVHM